MFDDNFDPTYGGGYQDQGASAGDYASDAAYYAKEGAAKAKAGAKKIIPIVIVAIIALVVIGFVFSFLSSQQTVNFTIKELDGKTISGARLIIEDSAGNKVLNKSGSNQTITLGPGEYSIRVTSIYHEPYGDTITIPNMDGDQRDDSIVVDLKKNLEGKITIDLAETEIYEKQTISGEIKIENTGDEDMIDDELFVDPSTSSDLRGDINFSPTTFTVSAGGSSIVSFTVTLDEDIEEIKSNETIEIRIKGTDISDDKEINLIPAVSDKSIEISGDVDTKQLQDDGLSAGEREDFDITIENDSSDIPLNNIKLTIIPDGEYVDELSWFEFADYAGSEKHTAIVSSISPDSEETLILKITPSVDSEIGNQFKGTLLIESLSIEERTISINLDLIVEEDKRAKLEFDNDDISTDCYLNEADCAPISTLGILKLENIGDVKINNINIDFDESSGSDIDCGLWIDLTVKTKTSLDVDEVWNIPFELNIPAGTEEPYTTCFLKAAYIDPLTQSTKVDVSEPFQIEITVEEEP